MIVTDFKLEHRIKFDDNKNGIRAYRAWCNVDGRGCYLDFKITDDMIKYSVLSLEDTAKMMVKNKLKEATTEEIFI